MTPISGTSIAVPWQVRSQWGCFPRLFIIWRVNLPISVGLVWLTNPITMPPIFYFCYKVGTWILETPLRKGITFELSFRWIMEELSAIWQPFLLGCFVMGVLSAVLGNLLIRLLWRLHVVRYLQRRRERKNAKNEV